MVPTLRCLIAAVPLVMSPLHQASASPLLGPGVRIFAYGVGPDALIHPQLLQFYASATGGAYISVPASADIRVELPLLNLTGLSDLELRNETTQVEARAVRVFPDGSFDGYVPLAEGRNHIRVSAKFEDGSDVHRMFAVRFKRSDDSDERARDQSRALLEALKLRTVETDLARRAQVEHRRRRLKRLDIQVTPDP